MLSRVESGIKHHREVTIAWLNGWKDEDFPVGTLNLADTAERALTDLFEDLMKQRGYLDGVTDDSNYEKKTDGT